jgi:hypothetical protein
MRVHASDKNTFEKFHDQTFGLSQRNFDWQNNLAFSKLFYNINGLDVYNTFEYLYRKVQKGIFIKFGEKCLQQVITFSSNEKNEWGHLIEIPTNLQKQSKFQVQTNTNYWQTNNGVMRYENPHVEHHNNVNTIIEMFDYVAKTRNIPKGLEVFINNRDFPVVTNDAKYEPYYNIYGERYKLIGPEINKMAPVLSYSKRHGYDDILIPTYEDWTRSPVMPIPWNEKINKAVFRGSSTGGLENNIRIKLCSMSSPFLDVGITKLNNRLLYSNKKLGFLSYTGPIVKKLSFQQQMKYKMIIHVEGHVSAFRLGQELASGSCLLMVESPWFMWFQPKPFVHYLPIKRDLSDLLEVIQWCLENDDKAKKIAENAIAFYKKYLSKEHIVNYIENLLIGLSNHIGSYKYAPEKWNAYIERILPPFTSYNDWFHNTMLTNYENLDKLNFRDQIHVFFQLLAKLQYLQWHFCAYMSTFFVAVETLKTPETLILNDLYDHYFLNTRLKVHIVVTGKLFYVKDHVTNYCNNFIPHNFYDAIKLFKHPILKSIAVPLDLSFNDAIKVVYTKYYFLHCKNIGYERKNPNPLIKTTLQFTPNMEQFYKYPFPCTSNTNKLVMYRQLQICDEWSNYEIIQIYKSFLERCHVRPVQFNVYNVGIPKNVNPRTLQYIPITTSVVDVWLSDDSNYVRLLYETLYSNKYITPKDKNIYAQMFKPLLSLDKVQYSINLARLQTINKYNPIHQ